MTKKKQADPYSGRESGTLQRRMPQKAGSPGEDPSIHYICTVMSISRPQVLNMRIFLMKTVEV